MRWKIADFGFSSPVGTKPPRPISYWNFPRNYCAPELLLTIRSDTKSDIWSAGCILFEVATGQPAFDTDEAIRKYAWLGIAPPSVSNTRNDLTKDVDDMVGQALQTSADLRPDAATILKDCREKHYEPTLAPILEIAKHEIRKISNLDVNLGENRFFATFQGKAESIIVESHGLRDLANLDRLDRLRQLGQLLTSLHNTTKASVPSFLGFVHESDVEYSLIFRAPKSIIPPDSLCYSLEHVLSTTSHPVHKTLQDLFHKVRVAATLAWTIHAIHASGFFHRAIGSHNVLIDTSPNPCPFIMGFDLETTQSFTTETNKITPSYEWRERLYQHPDWQSEENFTFRREYDFYSLGVVMLELARMVSFAQFSGEWRRELEEMPPEELQWFRIQRAGELKETVGEEYVRIMTVCLTGELGQAREDEVGQRFEEEVCVSLDRLASSLWDN